MGVNIRLVSLKEPCSGCLIITGLVKELLEKMKKERNNVSIEFLELKDLKNLNRIEGLEVERFPAIIINGEQITAGTFPDIEYLMFKIGLEE